MPSSETRSHGRVLTFSRSLAKVIKSFSLFSRTNHPQPLNRPLIPKRPRVISRPRQLRPQQPLNDYFPPSHFIHKFPAELLGLIFILGAEQDTFFPVTVSHVCSAWRQIALHTPALWRRITIGPNDFMWRERIRRAQACSLDIQLLPYRRTRAGIHHSQNFNPYTVNWYMHIVLPYIRQWRSLDVQFTEYAPYLWKAALTGCASPAPRLQDLSLVHRFNDDVQEFLLFAAYTPRLRRLTVDGIRLTWMPSLFGNLTFLDYTHHGFTGGHQAVHDIISILSISSRLMNLHILFPRGKVPLLPSRRDSVTKRVTLPFLTQLQLKVDGSDIPFELAHLVTLILAPSLSSLRLIDLNSSYHSFPSLKSFFYVYALPRTLRFVFVGHGWYDPKMIRAMTHFLPQLSRIHVKRSRTPDQVLNLQNRVKDGHNSASVRQNQQAHRHCCIDSLNVHYLPKFYEQ